MPRIVSSGEKSVAVQMMLDGVSQREIHRITGLSRPFIRKLSKQVNFQFARNGVEVVGDICICANCQVWFRRSKSKIERANKQFCGDICRKAHATGPNHPSWKHGDSAKTFSTWIVNQSEYKNWREAVLQKDNYSCVISGRSNELEAHHVLPKAEFMSPDKAFDINNGITLNKEVHTRIH